MQIYFAGGESQSHLDTLRSCGVERVGLSISNLARHTRDYAAWGAKNHLKGFDYMVYADSPTVPVAPLLELLAGVPSEPEAVIGPVDWATDSWLNDSDILFLPIWDGHDIAGLRHYVEMYDGVVLPDSVVENQGAVRTAKAGMGRMSMLGALTGRTKGIEKFDLLVSSAWWATQKHGETQVWIGNRLVRLNSEDKHVKRQRYAAAIEALGVNLSAVLADDPTETARLAVYSWLALERFLNQGRALELAPDPVPTVASPVATTSSSAGSSLQEVASGVPAPRHQSVAVLPVIAADSSVAVSEDADGNQILEKLPTIASRPDSVRQCNTCALSAACPGYSPGSRCSYNIPVVIRTRDQLQSTMRVLLEIQTQRVLFNTFAEQVNGTHDDAVGKEMDRLFTMLEKRKTIEEVSQKLTIGISATGADPSGNMGMISRLFGSQAGQNARMLDVPLSSDEVIEGVGAADVDD